MIYQAGNQLLELINEVLDLSKIESGQVPQSIELFRIAEISEELISICQPLAREYEVSIASAIPHGFDLDVLADKNGLKQALLNLITNAIKYNRRNGKVIISCLDKKNGVLRINVEDTGPGIPKDKENLLFEPFNRLGAEYSDIEGTGIGLTITKRVIGLMNGKVGVTSTEGKGSCFYIELPIGLRSHSASPAGHSHSIGSKTK